MSRRKTFCIVLESAEPALIEQWSRAGELPVLNRLRQRGVWSRLDSPSYISSGCSWPTLTTGTNPAKHGIAFFHREIENGTYNIIKKYSDHVKVQPFWHALGRAGFRNAIFDLATTLPTSEVNGAIVVDWGSEHPSWKTSSFPKDLINRIEEKIGRHPLTDYYQGGLDTREDYKDLADKLKTGVELRARALRYVLTTGDFDFILCNYSEPHWAGHLFWHLHDTSHPEHDPDVAAYCGDAMLDTYKACDRAIGELVAEFPNDNFLVLSNIGMGSHAGGDMMVPQILDKLGMSGNKKAAGTLAGFARKMLPGSKGHVAAVQNVEKVISPAMIKRIKNLFPERIWDKWTRRMLGLGNNWANSKAFLLPSDNSSLIRINLQGREPNGQVSPGDEYRALCAELKNDFMDLRDPASGKQAVEKVIVIREHLEGDHIDQLPDLAIVWNDIGAPLEALESAKIGLVEIPEYNKRPGGHLHEGFLVAAGPSFRNAVELKNHDVADLAPTILKMFGLPAPDYMDGRVIFDALQSEP